MLYVMVAFICAFAATSSFHARIIESYQRDLLPYTTEIEGRVGIIQQKYAEIYAEKLAVIEEKIDICRKKTILIPESTYWPKRLAQVLEDRHATIMERDSLISSVPEEHADAWVERHAAITGVTFEALPLSKYGAAAITAAVQELWDIGELSVKKLVALAIVLAIEIGIILLAIFARFYAKEAEAQKQELIAATEPVKREETVPGSSLKALTSTTESSEREYSSDVSRDRDEEVSDGSASKGHDSPSTEQVLLKGNGRYKKPDIVEEEDDVSRKEAVSEESGVQSEYDAATEDNPETEEPSREEIHAEIEAEKDSDDIDEESHSSKESPEQGSDEDRTNDINYRVMKRLQFEFRENDIERFLKITIPFYEENGKLIPANKLSRRLQPIRRALNKEFSKEELEIFFRQGQELSVLSGEE